MVQLFRLWRGNYLFQVVRDSNVLQAVFRILERLETQLQKGDVRGIVLFPAVIPWEHRDLPQRPHHLFARVAEKGFAVFWAEPTHFRKADTGILIEEVRENLFVCTPFSVWLHLLERLFPGTSRWIVVHSTLPYPYLEVLVPKLVERKSVQGGWQWIYEYLDTLYLTHQLRSSIAGGISLWKHFVFVKEGSPVRWVIPVSRFLERELIHSGVSPSRVRYLPNGVDLSLFSPSSLPPSPTPRPPTPLVIYHGAIAPWLDFPLIRKVVYRMKDVHFLFIGPSLSAKVEDLPLDAPNFTWMPPVPQEQLPGWLHCADVAWIPFRQGLITRASSPLKLFEYMAVGLPVVIPPDILEVVDCPGIFPVRSVEEVIRTIRYIISSGPEIRKVWKQEERRWVKPYDWGNLAERYVELLLGGGG